MGVLPEDTKTVHDSKEDLDARAVQPVVSLEVSVLVGQRIVLRLLARHEAVIFSDVRFVGEKNLLWVMKKRSAFDEDFCMV